MTNVSNIALSSKLASDSLMFDVEGKHIPEETAIKSGSPEKAGVKYVAFYVKYPGVFEIHAYYLTYSEEKRSAASVSFLEWPEDAKRMLTDRWGINFDEITIHENGTTVDAPSFIV
jgi:hypothetical protein